MKSFLIVLLGVFSLGLCGVLVKQWEMEARLRHIITEINEQLLIENTARIEAERKVREYEKEIARLTTLRAEVEGKLLTITEEMRDRITDQSARGYAIAVLMNEVIAAKVKSGDYRELVGKSAEAMKQHNEVVGTQNAAIAKANAQLKAVTTERDDAINRLNARTRDFNELVEKYNKLSKSR